MLLKGLENCTTPLENFLALSDKIKHASTLPSCNSPGYLPKSNESTFIQGRGHKYLEQISFNNSVLETSQVSIRGRYLSRG